MTTEASCIETKQVKYAYKGSADTFAFPDIVCKQGTNLLVGGYSGSGKTTLLSLLGLLTVPTSGQIYLLDQRVDELSESKRDALRGRYIGFALQKHFFLESLCVFDNLKMARSIAGLGTDSHKITDLLSSLDLYPKKDAYPRELSVGERQRLGVLRALVTEPKLVLADEPTSSLDNLRAERTIELLMRSCTDLKASLIVVSHDERIKTHFENQVSL